MNKIKTASITVLFLAVIVFVLLNNKRQMAAQSVPDIQLNVPVRVTTAQEQSLNDSFSLVGRVTASNDVVIVAETDGRVVAVNTEVGEKVTSGSVLVRVDDELKQAAYTAAEVNFEKAKRDLERFVSLRDDGTISESQYESGKLAAKAAEAEYIAAKRQLNNTKVSSPISGVVTSRAANIGTYVKNGDVIANVVDIAKLKILFNVAEKDVFKMKAGDPAVITVDVYPGIQFTGTIFTISDKGDAAHTYVVEVELPNSKSHPLKAGMFARGEFSSATTTYALAIPREAIAGSVRDPHVYVVKDGVASLRHIVVGNPVGAMLPVVSGIQSGEMVVLTGQNNLRDNSQVTILN